MNPSRLIGYGVAALGGLLMLLVLVPVLVLSAATTAAASCVTPAAGTTSSGVNPAIVSAAYTEAVAKAASPRVLLALFEAGLDESSFRNLANDNVPSSLTIPHDGVGDDHTSVGYLQQQVGNDGSGTYGWGDVVQAMDPLHATDAFLDAAVPLDATTAGDSLHETAGDAVAAGE